MLFRRLLRFIQRIIRDVRFFGFSIVLLVIMIKMLEYTEEYGVFTPLDFLDDLFTDVRSELISVALAILVFEWLSQQRHNRLSKTALIYQLGSPDNGFAKEAARTLQTKGWMADGTLRGVFLVRGNLERANLWKADLRDAELMGANLCEANLHKANLSHAKLWEADLTRAEILEANLQDVTLSKANLQGAQLWESNLQEAVLDHANLSGANLRKTNLKGALLIHADLRGAQLTGANLEGARLVNATFDRTTILPDGTNWTPVTDLSRFTLSNPADSWRLEK